MRTCAVLIAIIVYSSAVADVWAGASGPSELEARDRISKSAQRAFLEGNFAELESTSSRYRAEQSRTPSGLWKLTLFYAGIASALHTDAVGVSSKAVEHRVRLWQQQYPTSPTPHIALSELYLDRAWVYRGSGPAAMVREDAWEPFYNNVELARQNLEAHKAIAAVDPRWYETMLTVARAQEWSRDRFYELLEEALQREPYFYQTYFAAIQYLLPKWHGDVQEIEAFARRAVDRTAQQEGEGMYARIYWYVSQAQFRLKLFERSEVVWPRMKQGFDDVIAKYPDAWNLNNYARFACLARDKETTREVMERLPSEDVAQVWQPIQVRQGCWEWSH